MNATSFNVILVDDEPRGLSTLEKMLELHCPDVNISASCKSADEAIQKIRFLKPELLFLDIAMPVKTGFDLLNELQGFTFEIIFVTAHNQYMIDAFHFSAVDYLLKPINDILLVNAVKRAKKRIEEKSGHKNIQTFLHNAEQKHSPRNMRLCVSSNKGFQVVEIKDILYCEASGNYTNFHFTNHQLVCTSTTMREYEGLLEEAGFARIHKSHLVNLLHVKEYIRGEGGTVILTNGTELEVARRKKDSLLESIKAINKFLSLK
jgi:two-component system LytT family response regulator